jgi:hypothetical protein
MAKEWYLLSSPYDQVSGYENEGLYDFGQEGFLEAIETDIASDVEICNFDLSEVKPIRAIIQARTQDTKLNSITRQMLAPIGSCKAGMYVKYKGIYWLIVGFVDDNTVMYEKAVLSLCNWKLAWLNTSGKVIQRWVSAISASQYNNGETGMQFYFVRSDQLLISLPDDEESLLITEGCRFVIDKRCAIYEKGFDDSVVKDTSNPLITYQLTRSDTVLYNFGDSGHMEFIATQDEQHENDGYYKIDGIGYWLCDKPSDENDKSQILSSHILCDSTDIYNGLDAGIFTAKFVGADGKAAHVVPHWTVNCDFADKLKIIQANNSISISVNNRELINKSFELLLNADGYTTASTIITIKSFF